LISPLHTIEYYNDVLHFMEPDEPRADGLKELQKFARFFTAPGMQHCGGGPGPNVFDTLTALEQWVEKGKPPARIIATKYVNNDPTQPVVRTRPLCPYPRVAVYRGSGSTDAAANFVCKAPRRHEREHQEDD
jgi:feruloyl esterase